jgi:hypothetical protein
MFTVLNVDPEFTEVENEQLPRAFNFCTSDLRPLCLKTEKRLQRTKATHMYSHEERGSENKKKQ